MFEAAPLIIGITGQIGAGKSTLGRIFTSYGFYNLEVDEVGHAILQRPDIRAKIIDAFGSAVVDQQGQIDRRVLGRRVFADENERSRLNAIVHPPMIAEVQKRLKEILISGRYAGVIINAALLYEMGLDQLCNKIIYVRASPDIRLQRIMQQRGLSIDRAKARLSAQDKEPTHDSRVIYCDNNGSLEQLQKWVDKTLAYFAETSFLKHRSGINYNYITDKSSVSVVENFIPHLECDFDNTELTTIIENIPQGGLVPHCALSSLIDAIFLVPVDPQSNSSLIDSNGTLTIFPSMMLAKERITQKGSNGNGAGLLHIHATLRHLLEGPGGTALRSIAIAHPKGDFLNLDSKLIGKIRFLASLHPKSESIEIPAGESLVISAPQEEVPSEFIDQIRKIGRRHTAVGEVYLFEATFSRTGQDSLIIGVLPAESDDVVQKEKFDIFWSEVMDEATNHLSNRLCLDFMVLDDPALIEIVATTVQPIGVRS